MFKEEFMFYLFCFSLYSCSHCRKSLKHHRLETCFHHSWERIFFPVLFQRFQQKLSASEKNLHFKGLSIFSNIRLRICRGRNLFSFQLKFMKISWKNQLSVLAQEKVKKNSAGFVGGSGGIKFLKFQSCFYSWTLQAWYGMTAIMELPNLR